MLGRTAITDRSAGRYRLIKILVITAFGALVWFSPYAASAADGTGLLALRAPGVTQPNALPVAGDTEIKARLSSANLQVVGTRLNGFLLWRFYAAHGFEPIWESRPRQAETLLNAIWHADEQGLDPNAFHAALLARAETFSPSDRDLLLSDAFLAYADALARGAVPIERRGQNEALTPEPVDVVAALGAAIVAPDPAGSLSGLAPNSPAYAWLRQAYQVYRSTGAIEQAREVAVNLERLRWLPRVMPPDRVEVNTANAQLQLFRKNTPVFTTRVVVGETNKQTPELRASIQSILFNPPWHVPRSIAAREILPKLRADRGYLARHNMVLRPNGSVVQRPGPRNSLGQLKFEMPNRFDVYLHDTPMKDLFSRNNRRQSHGCVRVQNPKQLAALLLQEPVASVNAAIAVGYTHRQFLPTPIPVFILYRTVSAGPAHSVEFDPDVYRRDDDIWIRLRRGASVSTLDRLHTGTNHGGP